MRVLDIIIGYYLPSLFGWAFLVFVLILESAFLAKYLVKSWYNSKVYLSVIAANLITTMIGYLTLGEEGNGGHLLGWIPVDHYHDHIIIDRTISLFITSFIGTIIVETLNNILVLKQISSKRKIFIGTLSVNAVTYIAGAIVILLYAFS